VTQKSVSQEKTRHVRRLAFPTLEITNVSEKYRTIFFNKILKPEFYPDTLGLGEVADIGGVWGLCPSGVKLGEIVHILCSQKTEYQLKICFCLLVSRRTVMVSNNEDKILIKNLYLFKNYIVPER